MSLTAGECVRRRVRIEGTVQGVGFRPHVYRLARELSLHGHVLNDSEGVLLEVEGPPARVEEFLARVSVEAPPLAVVERIADTGLAPMGEDGFRILESPTGQVAGVPVSADIATCEHCLTELLDPADRRYRYPFINCTDCGPRFTIVRGVPYDRPLTTMAAFAMCARCQAEYDNPLDRRFHAQPNACPECGPSMSLLDAVGPTEGVDPLAAAEAALVEGKIVAIKGIGGYHLACRADLESAVAELRARKHREDKPFALMVPDPQAASAVVELDDQARGLLASPARPIVLAPRLPGAGIAAAVAPGAAELGVMLPYSPLHHLLLADLGLTLVLTSGNVSDEPIAFGDDDARTRLGSIADLFLVHDRAIHTRTDDSVVRPVTLGRGTRPLFVRRSRGYVPGSLNLPDPGTPRPLLACGAELKNTFCVAKGARAWVGPHVGDLANLETLRSFSDGVEHLQRLFAVEPEVVAHDLHPEYLSTKYALEREDIALVGVQHHHAHMAACLAEHGERGPAVAAIFDGAGYGLDETVWGGEILFGDLQEFQRVGSLRSVALPGGEQAIRQPWRMACAWLQTATGEEPLVPPSLSERVPRRLWRQVARLALSGVASPQTTSVGRLFDAIAALAGVRAEIRYEGQAAVELEAACQGHQSSGAYPMPVSSGDAGIVIDPRETVLAAAADVKRGEATGSIAVRFHAGLAQATVEACELAASVRGTDTVVLSGGVFVNRRLLETVFAGLGRSGLRVLVPSRLPPGDGGISYGQAAVAASRLAAGSVPA